MVEKLRFFLDQDSGMRSACLAAFRPEIAARRADACYVRIVSKLTHPFPHMSEPRKAVCYPTNYGDYDEDHRAWLYNKASLHAIDCIFTQVRRRLSFSSGPLLRPAPFSGPSGGTVPTIPRAS